MKPFDLQKRQKQINCIDFKNAGNRFLDVNFINNYLDINAINLDLSENVYKIFNWNYFIDDLKDSKLTLVRPCLWEDTFENFLLNSKGLLDDGAEVGFEPIRDKFYCSSWSLKKDCDGLWRNYKNKNESAIKAKTSTKKLFESIYNITDEFHYLKYFIGKVEYVSDDFISDFFQEKLKLKLNNYQGGIEFAQTLLYKRLPYAYEEEVRIIVNEESITDNLLKIYVNPNYIFDELILDPWITPNQFEQKKKELIEAGFTGTISRSSLYDKPFFVAKL